MKDIQELIFHFFLFQHYGVFFLVNRKNEGLGCMEVVYSQGNIQVVIGDITEETTDAIVNAANSTLSGRRRSRRELYIEKLALNLKKNVET